MCQTCGSTATSRFKANNAEGEQLSNVGFELFSFLTFRMVVFAGISSKTQDRVLGGWTKRARGGEAGSGWMCTRKREQNLFETVKLFIFLFRVGGGEVVLVAVPVIIQVVVVLVCVVVVVALTDPGVGVAAG